MTFNIIIPCALLDIRDSIEIDRFKRFQAQLVNISKIKRDSNLFFTFVEFGKEPKLESTIAWHLKHSFAHKFIESTKVNQIVAWKEVIKMDLASDYFIFTHSDILFPENLQETLNKRVVDSKNYYAYRFNTKRLDYPADLESFDFLSCSDYGFKYALDSAGLAKLYREAFASKIFKKTAEIDCIAKQIPESFMCISIHNWNKIKDYLKDEFSYHNDVVIRDISALLGIEHEWLNDDLAILHMLGSDDSLKTGEKDYDMTLETIRKEPLLAHFGMFRFHPQNIPYMKHIDVRNIYENYMKNRFQVHPYFEKEFLDFVATS